MYNKWNFTSWVKQLSQESGADKNPEGNQPSKSSKPKYETIFTESELDLWIGKLKSTDLISIDTETTSLDYMKAEIVGISCSVSTNHAVYIPLQHNYVGAPKQLSLQNTLEKLKPILEDETKKKVGQNSLAGARFPTPQATSYPQRWSPISMTIVVS